MTLCCIYSCDLGWTYVAWVRVNMNACCKTQMCQERCCAVHCPSCCQNIAEVSQLELSAEVSLELSAGVVHDRLGPTCITAATFSQRLSNCVLWGSAGCLEGAVRQGRKCKVKLLMSKACKVLLGHCCLVADINFDASKAVRSVRSSPSAVQQASLSMCSVENDIQRCCKVCGVKLSCPRAMCGQTLLDMWTFVIVVPW